MAPKGDNRATLVDLFRVARDPRLTPAEFKLWTVMRSYDSGEGAFPGDETLAEHLALSTRQVRRIRARLVELGYLEQGPRRGQLPTKYRAICPDISVLSDPPLDRTPVSGVTERGPATRPDTSVQSDTGPSGHPSGHQTGHPCPPSTESTEKQTTPSPYLPDSNNLPPSTGSANGRVDLRELFKVARPVLIEHCLNGATVGRDENGNEVGLGLLLRQLEELVENGYDPEEVLGAVAQVRNDESAPPRTAAYSFRWFNTDPARWHRAIGLYHKSL